jgi:exodeoxyribonuclease VII large subunit
MQFTVSQFIEYLNAALTSAVFPEGVHIEGEVSEYRVSQQKWIWFKLKDESSSVECFSTVWQMRLPLEDGMTVRVYGHPKVHGRSGKFSVTVERVEPVGAGALRRALQLLKRRLEGEGLFAPERKRPIPVFPARVGLIASSESAAYGDFLRVLGNRWGGLEINFIDVQVQGGSAPAQIAAAFGHFNAHPHLADVIVLTRGGGSLEDLMAFNTEEVVRAVFGSRLPVVVAVGHERDISLADLAADVRASTPTSAAEMIVPDRREVGARLDAFARGLTGAVHAAMAARHADLDGLSSVLHRRVAAAVADIDLRLKDFAAHFRLFFNRLRDLDARLVKAGESLSASAAAVSGRLSSSLDAKVRLLQGLDPRRLLERGYSIVMARGRPIRDAAAVAVGERLDIRLFRGSLQTEVKRKTS